MQRLRRFFGLIVKRQAEIKDHGEEEQAWSGPQLQAASRPVKQ